MKIRRTFDTKRVSDIVGAKDVSKWNQAAAPRMPTVEEYEKVIGDHDNFVFMCDEGSGVVAFTKTEDSREYETHATFVKGKRGEYARSCIVDCLAVLFSGTRCERIIGFAEPKRIDIIRLAKSVGATVVMDGRRWKYTLEKQNLIDN